MHKLARRLVAFLVALGILVGTGMFLVPARAEGEDAAAEAEQGIVDYVLVLDCTAKAKLSDSAENTRKAAAKLFVDLLPVDNARVTVINIGRASDPPDYSSSYRMEADDGHVAQAERRMRCIYRVWGPEQSIATQTDREMLKSLIDKTYQSIPGVYSDTHCALYAAMDTLKAIQSQNACVLLIAEETAANYVYHLETDENGGTVDKQDHTMLDDVKKSFMQHNWSLNWINLATESNDQGYREALTDVCRTTGGDVYNNNGVASLPQDVASVIERYSSARESKNEPQTLDAMGYLEYQLPTFSMLTEVNIVVTGSGVDVISVVDNQGVVTTDKQHSDVLWFSKEYDPGDEHFFYSALKVIRPASGGWKVRVDGEANSQVFIQTIQVLEPDILLTGNLESGAEISIGQEIRFNAAFQYAGQVLHCGQSAYENYLSGARLLCTDKGDGSVTEIPLSVEGEQYTAAFTADKSGAFDYCLSVDSNDFLSHTRRSNVIALSVENHAPEAIGAVSDYDGVAVGSQLAPIDLKTVFHEPDAQEMTYTLSCVNDRNIDVISTSENDYLTITAPLKDGVFEMELVAQDSNGGNSAPVSFRMTVVNRGPVVAGLPDRLNMVADAPALLMKIGLISEEEGASKFFAMDQYFTDPDGLPMTFGYENEGNLNSKGDQIITLMDDTYNTVTGEITLCPTAAGKATVYFTATDSAGVCATHEIEIYVRGVFEILFLRYWPVLAAIAAIVIIILVLDSRRRVQGNWSVEAESTEDGAPSTLYRAQFDALNTLSEYKGKREIPVWSVVGRVDAGVARCPSCDWKNPLLIGTLASGKAKILIQKGTPVTVKINDKEIRPSNFGKPIAFNTGVPVELRYGTEQSSYVIKLKKER